MVFTFFKLYKWYQIASTSSCMSASDWATREKYSENATDNGCIIDNLAIATHLLSHNLQKKQKKCITKCQCFSSKQIYTKSGNVPNIFLGFEVFQSTWVKFKLLSKTRITWLWQFWNFVSNFCDACIWCEKEQIMALMFYLLRRKYSENVGQQHLKQR